MGGKRFLVFEADGIGFRDEHGNMILTERKKSAPSITWPKISLKGRPDRKEIIELWEFHTMKSFGEIQPSNTANPDNADILNFPREKGRGIIRNRLTKLDRFSKPPRPNDG